MTPPPFRPAPLRQPHPLRAAEGTHAAPSGPEPEPVLEIVTFRLHPAVTAHQFLAAAEATRAPLARQPGFKTRRLTCDGTGLWCDLVEWSGPEDAQAAAQTVLADPGFGPFMAAIDGKTVSISHQPILWRMDG